MNIAHRYPAIVSFAVLCCLVTCPVNTSAARPQGAQLSAGEKKEYKLIQKRLRDHDELLSAAGWTLIHCADQKELKNLGKTLILFRAFMDPKEIPRLVEAGGIKGLKTRVASLLKSKDPVVRGFGAIQLAVIGDAAYKSDIAKLLADKAGPAPKQGDRLLYNYDRSRAAMALGLFRAKKYAPRLSALLQSSDEYDRVGAALGLGYMGAKAHVPAIAKLLSDRSDNVQTAAIQALAELNATKYAKDISKLLTSYGDPTVSETAGYALARLNAKEQSGKLAARLGDQFRKGDVSKALALLGAKEHTKDIAALIEDDNSLVRCDALIALGILDAKTYVKKVAAHLQDKEEFVRTYAAVALLLMQDRTNSEAIRKVVRAEWKLPEIASDGLNATAYFGARIELHPVVEGKQRELTRRVVQEWERMNRSEGAPQKDAPADAKRPRR